VADYSIFTGVSGPGSDAGDPGADINLGHIFQVSTTCWVTAIRFWRGATSINGTQKGRIFTVATQTVLTGTAVDFPALSGTGWQTATLSTPVQLTANTSYKVVVHFTDNYSATGGYWSTGAGVGGRTDGPLTAPDAGGIPLGIGSIKQGSYGYTADPNAYPDSYFGGGNYWVDLVVTDVDPGSTPTGTGTAPVTLAATGIGNKQATGTGTAAMALDTNRTGAKAATGSAIAGLTIAATGAGSHRGVGAVTAPVALTAAGVGVHAGAGSSAAVLTLNSSSTGVHRGVGTGTAPLILSASGVPPGRDLRLSIGRAGALWSIGHVEALWDAGEAGAT
jgi:hypothetical protein